MKLVDWYLLKEGHKVKVYGKIKVVKAPPNNGTIRCGNGNYYFNEVQYCTEDN